MIAMHDFQTLFREMLLGGLRPRHTVGTGLQLLSSGEPSDMGSPLAWPPGAAPAHPCGTHNSSCLRPPAVPTHEPVAHHL